MRLSSTPFANTAAPLHPRSPLSALFAAQSTIRVVINPGGGVGNLKASFTVMKQLRALGFEGTLDVCFHDAPRLNYERNLKNLRLFLDQIQDFHLRVQSLTHPELGKLIFRNLPYKETAHDIPFVPIAITGADHCFSGYIPFDTPKAILYHAAHYIQLNPTGWLSDDLNTLEMFTGNQTIVLPPDARLTVDPAIKPHPHLLRNTQLTTLLDLIQSEQEQNQLKFIFIYGLHAGQSWICPAMECLRLISAATLALKGTPLIFIVPYAPSSVDCPEADLSTQAKIYTRNAFSTLLSQLNKRTFKKNALLFTNRLPEAWFEKLAVTSFLTVTEGCNLSALLESTAHPYLHGGRKLTELPKLASSAPLELKALEYLHQQANDYLENPNSRHSAALIEFLSLLGARDPRLFMYFQARQQAYQKKPDLLVTSLTLLTVIQPDMHHSAFLQQLLRYLAIQKKQQQLSKDSSCYHPNPALTRLKQLKKTYAADRFLRVYYLYFLAAFTIEYMKKAVQHHTCFLNSQRGYLVKLVADYIPELPQATIFRDWAVTRYQDEKNNLPPAAHSITSLWEAFGLTSADQGGMMHSLEESVEIAVQGSVHRTVSK